MSSSKILHSHSGLERDLKLPKHVVLVDECFSNLFTDVAHIPFKHRGVRYLKVPLSTFIRRGGVFKNNDA